MVGGKARFIKLITTLGDTTPCRMAGVITSTRIDIRTARGGSPVLLSEVLLAHDVHVCIKRPSGALPPEVMRLPLHRKASACRGGKARCMKSETMTVILRILVYLVIYDSG